MIQFRAEKETNVVNIFLCSEAGLITWQQEFARYRFSFQRSNILDAMRTIYNLL